MRLCKMPARTMGCCDLPKGHAGDMHSSLGDGFYVNCEAPVRGGRCGAPAKVVGKDGGRRCLEHRDVPAVSLGNGLFG